MPLYRANILILHLFCWFGYHLLISCYRNWGIISLPRDVHIENPQFPYSANFPTKQSCHIFHSHGPLVLDLGDYGNYILVKSGNKLWPHFLLLFQMTVTTAVLFLHFMDVTNCSTHLPPKRHTRLFLAPVSFCKSLSIRSKPDGSCCFGISLHRHVCGLFIPSGLATWLHEAVHFLS